MHLLLFSERLNFPVRNPRINVIFLLQGLLFTESSKHFPISLSCSLVKEECLRRNIGIMVYANLYYRYLF